MVLSIRRLPDGSLDKNMFRKEAESLGISIRRSSLHFNISWHIWLFIGLIHLLGKGVVVVEE
ncbi:hypothetical protein MtrunA17_Chr6g0482701 [Medicago truncatula]|uniref:Transmembrane protein n=1 Tax=Medicago truncatula TaxID=3880 RepID=A0A396HH22_MEDTR|nr:hypothetical protein MtrunA17_Chr6g0482701 [Medicago truncatula]